MQALETNPIILIGYLLTVALWLFWNKKKKESFKKTEIFEVLLIFSLFFTHDIRGLFGAWFCQFWLQKKNFRALDVVSSSQNLILLSLALLSFYAGTKIFPHFQMEEISNVNPAYLAPFLLFSLFSIIPFPFHANLLVELKRRGIPALRTKMTPIAFYITFLTFKNTEASHEGALLFISILGLLLALYFVLASFKTISFSLFLHKVLVSLFLVLGSLLPFLSHEGLTGVPYLLLSLLLGITGLGFSLHFFSKRYGFNRISSPFMGLAYYNSSLEFVFLFFVLVLSNAPFTLSFVGEDIFIYDIFSYSWGIGFFVLVLISLNAISLFRFYGLVFCGKEKENLPLFPMEKKESLSLFVLCFLGLVMAFLPL